VLWDKDRSFARRPCRAMLAGCPVRVSAWASCSTIFTLRRNLGPASAGRAKHDLSAWTITDDWPERVPVTQAEVDIFEAWFGDLFDEMFGTCR
jgi:hypothetical protein